MKSVTSPSRPCAGWIFNAAIGYKFERKPGHGKTLVPDEPAASIIVEALEGFAAGRFETISEVRCFLLSKPGYPRDRNGDLHVTKIREMLERVLYTGYMEYKPWGITLQTDSETLVKAYEAKITKIEYQKAEISSKLASSLSGPESFEESFQTVFDFIENPQKLWHSDSLEDRRLLLKLLRRLSRRIYGT